MRKLIVSALLMACLSLPLQAQVGVPSMPNLEIGSGWDFKLKDITFVTTSKLLEGTGRMKGLSLRVGHLTDTEEHALIGGLSFSIEQMSGKHFQFKGQGFVTDIGGYCGWILKGDEREDNEFIGGVFVTFARLGK